MTQTSIISYYEADHDRLLSAEEVKEVFWKMESIPPERYATPLAFETFLAQIRNPRARTFFMLLTGPLMVLAVLGGAYYFFQYYRRRKRAR